MNRPTLSVLCFASALLAACGGSSNRGDLETAHSALVTFRSCSELETYIQDTAVLQMRDGIRSYRYVLSEAVPAASPTDTAGKAAPDHSETTAQVAGVDEADFVKTDGNRVFYIVGRRLLVLRSWPANETKIVSTTQIEGYPTEMFLSGDKLVVFSRTPSWTYDPSVAIPYDRSYWYDWYGYSDATKVTVFDVTSDTPIAKNEYYLGGSYASSRRIGSVVRLVLSASLRWPDIAWYLDTRSADEAANDAALAALKDENEAKIRAWPLEKWLPKSTTAVNGVKRDVTPECMKYHKPTAGARLGLATVATLDLEHPEILDLTTVVSEVGQIYANLDSLYIASPQWWWGRSSADANAPLPHTWLHKFSLAQPDRTSYLGSGGVPGTLIDQYSMDESDGFLRVATNVTDWSNGWQNPKTENRVYVLAEKDGELAQVGATPPIAPGERIYSSRFAGTKGFVVTYRQIDPLFTLDLSNPTDPRVVGELSIPGVSTYIQPLDENHLLTVGMDTVSDPATGAELRNGVALQVFDVSDMAHPTLTAKATVGTRHGYSEALWDPKAFNYFAKTGVLAIPFTDWIPGANDFWGTFVSQLKLFHIDAAGKIDPLGAIDHRDLYQQWNETVWYWWYEPYIRRSVQIESFVYSFSYAGVKVNDVNAPTVSVATVPVPPEDMTAP